MLAVLKTIIGRISPGFLQFLISLRFFFLCRKRLRWCQDLIAREIFPDGRIHVLGGPLQGMKYYNKIIWGTITSKWLGCYEEEISTVISEIISHNYPIIVDVGAAEGYYAVGLALKLPMSKVITYDIDPIARYRQRQLAKLNGINNMEIRKWCSHEDLEALSGPQTVIICDIEGYEAVLLNPDTAPGLKKSDILVEIHHFDGTDVAEVATTIENRFEKSHTIIKFPVMARSRQTMQERIPKLKLLTDAQVDFALDEGRYDSQVWLWMKAKVSA